MNYPQHYEEYFFFFILPILMDVTNISKYINLSFKKSLFVLLIVKICFLPTELLSPTFPSP